MAEDLYLLQVQVEDRPGSLAEASGAISGAGVNIEAVLAYTVAGETAAQFVVSDGAAARLALKEAGLTVIGERQVLATPIEDRVGALEEITRRLASEGISLYLLYLASSGRLLVGAHDIDKARALL